MSQSNVRISVRNLIEFIYRQGDIDDRFGSITAAHEGTRLHKVIQKELKEECDKHLNQTFVSEMFLSKEFQYKSIDLTLEGRADGVIVTYEDEEALEKSIMSMELVEEEQVQGYVDESQRLLVQGETDEIKEQHVQGEGYEIKKQFVQDEAQGLVASDVESGEQQPVQGDTEDIKVQTVPKESPETKEDEEIILANKSIKVVEIKTTVKDIMTLEENENFLHWAQGKLYCYILCLEEGVSEIDLDLIYCHRENLHTKTLSKHLTLEELEAFFNELMDKYVRWIMLQDKWLAIRDKALEELNFPFSAYRKGQRELAVNIYRTMKEKKDIYIEAPTGTGKTISTMFPALKALSMYPNAKLVYLTAKNITKTVAEETLTILRNKGLKLKTLTLTAKDKICFLEERSCNGEDCIYARGHFDRVNDAMLDLLENHEALTQELIMEYGKKYTVCPFELSLDLIQWSDLVIGDYNYFFDPKAMIKRLEFDDTPYIFLIDEAHNLVDRARDMYSATITTEELKLAKEELKYKNKKLVGIINKVIKAMKERVLEGEEKQVIIDEGPDEILNLLRLLTVEGEAYLKEKKDNDKEEAFMNIYFNSLDFIRIGELFSEDFVYYGEKIGKDYILKLFCLNPSQMIKSCIERNITTVFFSATLSPMGYFKKLLGGKEDSYSLRLPSPFPPENRKLIIKTDVDTRYRYREGSYEKVVRYIHETLKENEGNFLVFFPSFEYMENIYELYSAMYSREEIFAQTSGMSEEERHIFLKRFEDEDRAVGFAVLGGVFSEGIDLWGDKLKGAIVVGVGLPKVNFERKLIEEYFTNHGEPGFHYAYTFPGMNKVIQAMGRVIRREEDTGTIVLMDKRYAMEIYKNLMQV